MFSTFTSYTQYEHTTYRANKVTIAAISWLSLLATVSAEDLVVVLATVTELSKVVD